MTCKIILTKTSKTLLHCTGYNFRKYLSIQIGKEKFFFKYIKLIKTNLKYLYILKCKSKYEFVESNFKISEIRD